MAGVPGRSQPRIVGHSPGRDRRLPLRAQLANRSTGVHRHAVTVYARAAMTPEQRQEEIMKAYIQAIAAKCSVAVSDWTQDQGCVDCTLGAASSVGGGRLARPKVDLQMKATTQQKRVEHAEYISWPLKISHYDQMRAPSPIPMVLAVLLLPAAVETSVEHTLEHILIRRCAFWVNMVGMPAVPEQDSKTVHLPKENVFSPDALTLMLDKVSRGEQL